MAELGKLKKVDLRVGWDHEALDFTNWLAKEENLAELSEELGIEDIKVLQTEANAGDFKIDILAEEEQTGHKIIIENQLEKTNHDHLGKILTYASSQDAKYIIWIAKEIRDEHKQAIDWLNEHTDEDISFFAIQIELWQIGNSEPAPKFNTISKPNDWAKVIKKSSSEPKLTDTKLAQLEFWNKFKEYAEKNSKKLKLRKTDYRHWYDISIGSSEAHIALTIHSQKNMVGCELYIPNNKELYGALELKKALIEKDIGNSLSWQKLEGKKASRIRLLKETEMVWEPGQPIAEETLRWLMKTAEIFQDIFGKYIKEVSKE